MTQLNLFDFKDRNSSDKPVNVAQVRQLSPFRYPGGKTWLVPRVRKWITSIEKQPVLFVEPFAGGGIITLTVAFEQLAKHCLMVELDDEMASVWKTIIYGDWQWLVDRILSFNLTIDSARSLIESEPENTEQKAFRTILKNRTYHGGILAPGSGLLKYGENGKGIHSRWYPDTITRRITAIASIRERIDFVEQDGFISIVQNLHRPEVAYFIDPPYTASKKKAGKRLYRYYDIDHENLFQLMTEAKGHFMMTYDDAEEIRKLCAKYSLSFSSVPMTGTHHRELQELIICDNLDWI